MLPQNSSEYGNRSYRNSQIAPVQKSLKGRFSSGDDMGDRREFTRIPIPWDQSATFLRSGFRQFTVHLIDATPQGYSITCPERLTVGRGDLLQLRTSGGWVEVRVANVKPLGSDDFPAEYDCLLGLARVRDLGFGPDENWLVSLGPRSASILLAIAFLAALAIGGVFLSTSDHHWLHTVSRSLSWMR